MANETQTTGFYHYLTLHKGQGFTNTIIGSDANNIDEAANERSNIAKKYNPNQIQALTTHNRGVGPACS